MGYYYLLIWLLYVLFGKVVCFNFHRAPVANITIGVVCGPHTLFIAAGLVMGLRHMHITADVLTKMPNEFDRSYYIVLTPQIFGGLFPPKSKFIIYQLEQTVSNRWMRKRYLKNLKNSCTAIVDYKMQNIEFLRSRRVMTPIAYLPINPIPGVDTMPLSGKIRGNVTHTVVNAVEAAASEQTFDILFYGDASTGRRKRMLAAVKKAFPGRVISVSNVFGPPLQKLVKTARVVLNMHYYENGMLETPRIFEALSVGVPVVSEDSADAYLYPELVGVVTFFKIDSVSDMEVAIRRVLLQPPRQIDFDRFHATSSRKFHTMLERFLLQIGVLPPVHYRQATILDTDSSTTNQVVLSPPEFYARRLRFQQVVPRDTHFTVYDGFLFPIRWIGCAMAYARLAQYAVRNNMERLTVCEDDVDFPPDYSMHVALVHRYLSSQRHWDFFSGLIAVVDESVNVTKAEYFEGHLFVTIDTASSAVFNIYNRSMLLKMASWDQILTSNTTYRNLQRYATIDRHMVRGGANVVVMLPFLVGHAPGVISTLWSKDTNLRLYGSDIEKTEILLTAKAEAFVRGGGYQDQVVNY